MQLPPYVKLNPLNYHYQPKCGLPFWVTWHFHLWQEKVWRVCFRWRYSSTDRIYTGVGWKSGLGTFRTLQSRRTEGSMWMKKLNSFNWLALLPMWRHLASRSRFQRIWALISPAPGLWGVQLKDAINGSESRKDYFVEAMKKWKQYGKSRLGGWVHRIYWICQNQIIYGTWAYFQFVLLLLHFDVWSHT